MVDGESELDFTLAQNPDEARREWSVLAASKLVIETEIFKNGSVSADDLGPLVTELAQGIEHYLINGSLMKYLDPDGTTPPR